MSTLLCLSYIALNTYTQDMSTPNNLRNEIAQVRDEIDWIKNEWEDLLENPDICRYIYIALHRWKNKRFIVANLTDDMIKDAKQMILDIENKYEHF